MKSEPVESAQAESTQTEGAQSESDVEAMTAASEQMAPPAGSVGEPTPDAGLPVEDAAQPIPIERTEDASDASPTSIAAEAPIELAALETSSASEPVPTVLGFVVHYCERLADSGMHLRISDLLLAGGMHRFMRTCPNGRQHEERIFDVRTCLLVDELLGPARKSQLDQGEIAAAAVLGWFKEGDDVGERALAARIPFLPKRDSYPAQVAAARR